MSTQYPEIIRIELPATTKYLSVLSACIAEILARVENLEQRESVTYTIQLAAHEACANIVDHAYAGGQEQRISIVLTLAEHPRRFTIDMYDHGESFDIERTSSPTFEEPQVRGYGLYIIRSLMDEVSYHPAPGNNHWCLMKHL
ncbi:MAG TPA: ATP-binding protein [Kouleothrix sp.]|mgnify:CR=1 FL=1|uniref:ATP-binding protein n=1 Tax=Kouleothrix sp. TaxID=2779161 RepID=UPI002CBB6D76|nr:ATP-binding protein [Kouleothrix sp.]